MPTNLDDNLEPSILSSAANLKYLSRDITENQIVDLLSDIKHRIFPRPFERISRLRGRTNLVGCEIGVAGGEHAKSLLETLDIKMLYLIDPYEMYSDYEEGLKHYGIDQMSLSSTEYCARQTLGNWISTTKWVKKLSADALSEIPGGLDFVYIDGNHSSQFVTEDLENYFPLLDSYGVIGGHDFYNGSQRDHDGVVSAVTSFVTTNNLSLRVELPDWWIEI